MKFKRIDDLYDYLNERHMDVLDNEEYEELKKKHEMRLNADKEDFINERK